MTRPKVPWLKVDMATKDVHCERCGERERIPLPLEIKVAVKWLEYATEKHRACRAKVPA